ncbi:MAG: GNAT family N-acetyltransferase [Rhodopseudomonas palustris]|uniref:GNAT family N-acetyltransferase n=1 Tax=Rhodopseudomonas palustris TaxID=1076 RepID=A0A933RXP4_RHOPL|nr:GNAT family N-acetyltransferase [Rhodopseudomonas palustris]
MIRPARLTDRGAIIRLLREANGNLGKVTGFVVPFDPAYAARLFIVHMDNSAALALVHDIEGAARGVLLAAVADDHPFGPVRYAKETLFWIDPAHRGGTAAFRLIDSFDQWWRDLGCSYGFLAGMGDDPLIAKFYERLGYRRAETHFLKAA